MSAKEHTLAALLQYRLIDIRRSDHDAGSDHLYMLDPNVIDAYLDPRDRAYSGRATGQLLGIGEIRATGGNYAEMDEDGSPAAVTASIARYIFDTLSRPNPLYIPQIFFDDLSGLQTRVRSEAQRKFGETIRATSLQELLNADTLDEKLDQINKYLFLNSNEREKAKRLASLVAEEKICSEPKANSPGAQQVADQLRELEQWRNRAELYFVRLDIEKAVQESTNYSQNNSRVEKLVDVLTLLVCVNARLSKAGVRNKLILITQDTKLLDVAQMMTAEGGLLEASDETPSLLEHAVRHPRCFLSDQGVLPKWESILSESYETISHERDVIQLEIDGSYETTAGSLLKNIAPSDCLASKTRTIRLARGKVDLSSIETSRLNEYLGTGDVVLKQIEDFDRYLEQTLKRASALPSRKTMHQLEARMKEEESLTSEEVERFLKSIEVERPRLNKDYRYAWINLMANSLDAFFLTHMLSKIERPKRTPALINHTTASIAKFITFTDRSLRETRTDQVTLNTFQQEYSKLIDELKEADGGSYYSLALSHAYAFGLLGDWEACVSSARFAIATVPEFNRTATTLNLRKPNGREAYFYLCFALRQSARSPRHFENLRVLMSKCRSIAEREAKGIQKPKDTGVEGNVSGSMNQDLTHDFVMERFELEEINIDISEILTSHHIGLKRGSADHKDESIQAGLYCSTNIEPQVRDIADRLHNSGRLLSEKLLSVGNGEAQDVSKNDATTLRKACYDSVLINLLSLYLQFDFLGDIPQNIWDDFKERHGKEARASINTNFIYLLGLAYFEPEHFMKNSTELDGLNKFYKNRRDLYVFPYDKERVKELFRAVDSEILDRIRAL